MDDAATSPPREGLLEELALPTAGEGLPAPASVEVRPPGSKSITNRALLLAGCACGRSELRGALLAGDDGQAMLGAVRALGARVDVRGDVVSVEGTGGRWRVPEHGVRIDVRNSGTTARFVLASAVLATGPVEIDGHARMRERPIAELVEALRDAGVRIDYLRREGCLPVRVFPLQGAKALSVRVRSPRSSQFVSALLLLGASLPGGLTLRVEGETPSASYVRMTLDVLAHAGAVVQTSSDLRVVRVRGPEEGASAGVGVGGFTLEIEPDASGATYLWAAGMLVRNLRVGVRGLSLRSVQGDAQFATLLGRMGGVLEEREDERGLVTSMMGTGRILPVLADMRDMPDAALTLASVACFASGTSVLRGLKTLRDKESDRVRAMTTQLAKLGVDVRPTHDDGFAGSAGAGGAVDALTITPPAGGVDCSPGVGRVVFETFDDHRVAMALALVGLRRPNCLVRDPACVGKTYPDFWEDWRRIALACGQ